MLGALKSQLFEILAIPWQSVDMLCPLPHKNNKSHTRGVGRKEMSHNPGPPDT